MSTPLSPGPATTTGLDELPAYLSNGLIGLRALDIPDTPPSRSFFANLGGFLSGLLYGLPGIRLGADEPSTWPSRPVVLPAGWRSIEVERGGRVEVRRGSHKVRLARMTDAPFTERLVRKFSLPINGWRGPVADG